LLVEENELTVGNLAYIKLRGQSNSICGLSAIDKSVTFMGKRNSIDFDQVFNKLAQFESEYDNQNEYKPIDDNGCDEKSDYEVPPHHGGPIPISVINRNSRSLLFRPSFSSIYDPTKSFRVNTFRNFSSDLNFIVKLFLFLRRVVSFI
jgi:hypothetical protein